MKNKNNLSASDFAYVGDPNNPDTWAYPMSDEADTRASLGKIYAAPKDAQDRAEIAEKLLKAAKSFGISDDDPIVQGVKDLVEKQLAAAESAGTVEQWMLGNYRTRGSAFIDPTALFKGAKSEMGHTVFVTPGMDTRDKIQAALDGMLGVKQSTGSRIAPFRGIAEAYVTCTGDENLAHLGRGGFSMTTEAIATTDFPNMLLDSINKKLIQDYTEYGMGGLEQVLTEGGPLKDYRTQYRVREGYFSDLPIVNEAGPYLEINKPTDEQISYRPQKRGGVLTISEETIRADDTGKIKEFPQRLARAGRHTVKTFITNFFVNNPNYGPDSISWFNASHNNVFTSSLSFDSLIAAESLQMKQTEKDSGNRLPFRISWIMVPVDLATIAWQINNSDEYNPGPGLKIANPFYLRFGPAGTGKQSPPGIIVNELLLDANDWYYGVDANDIPIIEIAYIDGNPNPEIIMASAPNVGTMMSTDQIQYKAKFGFGGAIKDFRGAGKSTVP